MKASAPPERKPVAFPASWLEFWVAPPRSFVQPEDRQPPRMLAACSLSLALFFGALDSYFSLTVDTYQPPWLGYLALGVIYGLARSLYYRVGAVVLALMFPCVALLQVGLGQAALPVVTLGFVSLSPLVGALFLSLRSVLILGAINLAGFAAMPWL